MGIGIGKRRGRGVRQRDKEIGEKRIKGGEGEAGGETGGGG